MIEINKTILRLLDTINSGYEPEIVNIIPEDYSTEKNCYYNVLKKIEKDGGKIHYGWKIHENEFFYEAERHSVWENEQEDLIDITPQEHSKSNKIFFVSDNEFTYQGQLIPNIRINSTKNAVVDDYIFLLNKKDYLYSFSTRKNERELLIDKSIKLLIDKIELLSNIYYTFIKIGKGNSRSQCFCNSTKIYKNCHGNFIKENINNKANDVLKK